LKPSKTLGRKAGRWGYVNRCWSFVPGKVASPRRSVPALQRPGVAASILNGLFLQIDFNWLHFLSKSAPAKRLTRAIAEGVFFHMDMRQ